MRWIIFSLAGCEPYGATTGTTTVVSIDSDSDGSPDEIDCDDTDPSVYPNAPDRCGDDRTTDCNRASDDGLVTVNGTDTHTDLQSALDAAPAGATVLLCPGTYTGPLVASVPVRLVSHAGASVTILDGAQAGSTLSLPSDSEIIGLTITGGRQPESHRGGGVHMTSSGALLVEDCVVTGNAASSGGGLYLPAGSAATIRATLVEGNLVEENFDNVLDVGGGIFAEDNVALDLVGSTVTGNESQGIYIRSGSLTGGVVTGNLGKGLWIFFGANNTSLEVIGTEISYNAGTGIWASGNLSTLVLADVSVSHNEDGGLTIDEINTTLLGTTEIVNNTAEYGAGINFLGSIQLTGGYIANNTATVSGGGVRFAHGSETGCILEGAVIEGNTAPDGAGISFEREAGGETSILGGRISNNTATGRGGAVFVPSGSYYLSRVVLDGVEISDNVATEGGGLYVEGGILTLEESTLERNVAGQGGGAVVAGGGLLESVGSSFGLAADQNVPGDIFASGELSGYGDNATFSCTQAGCDPEP